MYFTADTRLSAGEPHFQSTADTRGCWRPVGSAAAWPPQQRPGLGQHSEACARIAGRGALEFMGECGEGGPNKNGGRGEV